MVKEIKAKLEQQIKEVNEWAKILGLAANLATDLKVKALEEKLVIFEKENNDAKVAREQLSQKVEAL
jgi:hypothetical protein